jgi:hydrogenase nickel incorporation protein HypA/HybF
MHEEALLRDLVEKLGEVARADDAGRVTRVRVRVGALAHFSEVGLRNRWPSATQGTVAEGSELDVTVSSDPSDPRAQELVLLSVTVAEREEPSHRGRESGVLSRPPHGLKKDEGVRAPVGSGSSKEGG